MQTIGSVILIVVLVLISFGFLVDYSLNLHQELIDTRDQFAHMQAEMQTLQAQYQAMVEEKNRLTEQIVGLTGDNAGLRARIETLEADRRALMGQIDTLQSKLALIENANPILVWLVSSSDGRVAALLVLPILPLSFGAVYVMTHQKSTNLPAASTKGLSLGQTTFQAALTREEFHLITRHRRSRQADKRVE
jgi:cell division protein FtsB